MKRGNWIFAGTLALLGIALVLPAAAQSDSAIVHAAKQKASEKKSGHVFTNEDLGESPASDTTVANQGTGASGSTSPDATSASDGSDKADTKAADKKADGKSADSSKPDDQKLKDLEAKLADAKKGEQELQRKLESLQEKADSTQDQFRKNMYQDMISNQQVTLSEFRREQESLAGQIAQEKSKTKDQPSDQDQKTNEQ